MEGYQQGSGRERGGKGTGSKKQNWQAQTRQGELKNSIRNGEAKELICMTHGHELLGVGGENTKGNGGTRQRGIKGREKMGQL